MTDDVICVDWLRTRSGIRQKNWGAGGGVEIGVKRSSAEAMEMLSFTTEAA